MGTPRITEAEAVNIARRYFIARKPTGDSRLMIQGVRFTDADPCMFKAASWLVVLKYQLPDSVQNTTAAVFVDACTGEASLLEGFPL
jgi:hypothetical protein